MRLAPPPAALQVARRLHQAGYAAYFVGGCVRDGLLKRTPADWDIATSALPEQTQKVFPDSVAVGAAFGVILVRSVPDDTGQATWRCSVEVTTFRKDLAYLDHRRPIGVEYSGNLLDDLQRRDFTVNAMAWNPATDELVDPYGGQADLAERMIRAVGDPELRFREDALRLLRAVRFAVCLGFDIEDDTWTAAAGLGHLVSSLSNERVYAELLKILAADDVGRGLWMLHELGILTRIFPELQGSERLRQGKRGAPTLLDHLIQTAAACPPDPELRLAGFLHDIGKLNTRRVLPDGKTVFHGHDEEGAQLAATILRRLRCGNRATARVLSLIRNHMAHGPVTTKTLRRWLAQHGADWAADLLALRRADYLASGGEPALWPDALEKELAALAAEEGRLRFSDLQVNGHDIMQRFHLPPGPLVGRVLRELYEIVLTDPSQNVKDTLFSHAQRLLAAEKGQVQ